MPIMHSEECGPMSSPHAGLALIGRILHLGGQSRHMIVMRGAGYEERGRLLQH